jgi:hypothetical protein
MTAQRALSDYEQDILDNVARTGCHITVVVDPDQQDPPFAYSVGFKETAGQPEVIVLGLSTDMMTFMINETLDQCEAGLVLSDGVEIDGLLRGHKVIGRAVAARFIVPGYFNSAIWYERRRRGRALESAIQLVWPGAQDGLFPWDEGCDQEVRDLQPALYAVGGEA